MLQSELFIESFTHLLFYIPSLSAITAQLEIDKQWHTSCRCIRVARNVGFRDVGVDGRPNQVRFLLTHVEAENLG